MVHEVKDTEVLIVGGGLSGLALAYLLNKANVDFQLVESRDRFGGRIKTAQVESGYFDLGPAWFWPGQSRIATLARAFDLRIFEQYSSGDLIFQDQKGTVQRGRGYASMQGSLRLEGGVGGLIAKIAKDLPPERVHISTRVQKVSGKTVSLETKGGPQVISAGQVAFALPPRLIDDTIVFEPPLDPPVRQAMRNTPTWMAGQAKAVAIYKTPFWRAAGLSGDAMSHAGPMVEIHDASPLKDGLGALFGFIGVPTEYREDEQQLRAAVLQQFGALFGDAALDPVELVIKDWAFDPATATAADRTPLRSHPSYGMPSALAALGSQGLLFCGTEVAPMSGGYLEGALEAAESLAGRILKTLDPKTDKKAVG